MALSSSDTQWNANPSTINYRVAVCLATTGLMSNHLRRAITGLLFCIAFTAATSTALAQATTGTIAGTLMDPSEAVIVGARITVRNIDTNISRIAQSGREGQYSFPALPIGNYEVTIEQPGFGKIVRGPILLTLNQTAVVDA